MLRAESLWGETFTGLRMGRFEKSVKAVRERGGNGPGGGRPWCLPLADRVLLVAVYYRTNLTMRQLSPLLGISPATVCRVIHRLRPLLAIEPAPRPVADVERLWIVDGTLVPVRDRKVAASSRNYRFSANGQVIIDADSRLVIASARPVPGNTEDGLLDDRVHVRQQVPVAVEVRRASDQTTNAPPSRPTKVASSYP